MVIKSRNLTRRFSQLKGTSGSLTVEAALSFPLFMIAMVLLLLLLKDIGHKDKIQMDLLGVSEQLSRIELNSGTELMALSLAAVPFIELGEHETLIPVYPKLYPDGRFQVSYLWTRDFPIVGKKSQVIKMTGRGLYLGNRDVADLKSKTVYVTDNGEKYHLRDCKYLKKSANAMDEKEALKQKYEPCWICIGGLDLFEKAPGGGSKSGRD